VWIWVHLRLIFSDVLNHLNREAKHSSKTQQQNTGAKHSSKTLGSQTGTVIELARFSPSKLQLLGPTP